MLYGFPWLHEACKSAQIVLVGGVLKSSCITLTRLGRPGGSGPQGFRIQPTPEQDQKGKALELYVSCNGKQTSTLGEALVFISPRGLIVGCNK